MVSSLNPAFRGVVEFANHRQGPPMTRRCTLLAVLVALPTLALAGAPAKKQLVAAADGVDDAATAARRASPRCRGTVEDPLKQLAGRIDGIRRTDRPAEVAAVRLELSGLGMAAASASCPPRVTDNIQQALDALEDARVALLRSRPGPQESDPHPQGESGEQAWAQLAPLSITPNSVYDREPAVRVLVTELNLSGMQGATFYLGAKFRSAEGGWSDWVTTQAWSTPRDPFVWKNAFNHFFRYSSLAEEDYANGRFIAHVGVFDGSGRELTFREAGFKVTLSQLPTAPPPTTSPPGARDCGFAQDPGCSMTRDGQWAMDAVTFNGFATALRSNSNEMMRLDVVRVMFRSNWVTALQLGAVLDLFGNEMFRLDVAKMAAPRVVNPQHALGHAARFRNGFFAGEYTKLMAEQSAPTPTSPFRTPAQPLPPPPPVRPQPMPPLPVPPQPVPPQPVPPQPVPPQPVPPQPMAPPAPPRPGQVGGRDCGTGQDPGCSIMRAGGMPMDAPTFQGFVTSLRSSGSDFARTDICKAVLRDNFVTALQLAQVLDLFDHDQLRLDAATLAAPHVVNPLHALGYAAKFRSNFHGQQYTQLMANQR
jgi:hypothetical protein